MYHLCVLLLLALLHPVHTLYCVRIKTAAGQEEVIAIQGSPDDCMVKKENGKQEFRIPRSGLTIPGKIISIEISSGGMASCSGNVTYTAKYESENFIKQAVNYYNIPELDSKIPEVKDSKIIAQIEPTENLGLTEEKVTLGFPARMGKLHVSEYLILPMLLPIFKSYTEVKVTGPQIAESFEIPNDSLKKPIEYVIVSEDVWENCYIQIKETDSKVLDLRLVSWDTETGYNYYVDSGTPEQFLEHLIKNLIVDETSNLKINPDQALETFLTTWILIMPIEKLFEELRRLYATAQGLGEDRACRLRLKIVQFVHRWLVAIHDREFNKPATVAYVKELSEQVVDKLRADAERGQLSADVTMISASMAKILGLNAGRTQPPLSGSSNLNKSGNWKQNSQGSGSGSISKLRASLTGSKQFFDENSLFGKFTTQEIAYDLTLFAFEVFRPLHMDEFIHYALAGCKFIAAFTPNLEKMVNLANNVSYWVAAEICQTPDIKIRANLIRTFLEIAAICKSYQNLAVSCAILAGLQNPAVERLKGSWEVIPENKNVLAELEILSSPSQDFANYHTHVKTLSPPFTILLSPLFVDLPRLDLKDLIRRDGNFDFGRIYKLGKLLAGVKYAKSRSLDTLPAVAVNKNSARTVDIQNYLQNFTYLDNEELHTLSKLREPNLKSSSDGKKK